jgi:hypothetical protein
MSEREEGLTPPLKAALLEIFLPSIGVDIDMENADWNVSH